MENKPPGKRKLPPVIFIKGLRNEGGKSYIIPDMVWAGAKTPEFDTPAVVVPDMTPEEARAVFTPDYGFNVNAIEDACHYYPAAVLVLLAAALQKQEAPDAAHSKNT